MKRVNDVNYVVQRSPESQREIVHRPIDRLSQFHGTIPPKWKKVVAKEKTALENERSVSKDGRNNDHKMTEMEGINDLVLEDSDGNVLSANRPRGVNVTAEQPEPTWSLTKIDVLTLRQQLSWTTALIWGWVNLETHQWIRWVYQTGPAWVTNCCHPMQSQWTGPDWTEPAL